MPKLLPLLLLAAIGIGGYYFFTHYSLDGWDDLKVKPLDGTSAASGTGGGDNAGPPVAVVKKNTIRIAAANLGPLDQQKLNNRDVARQTAEILRRFDVVAIQDIWASNQGLMLDLLDQVNQDGRNYDYAVPERVGRMPVEKYSAFLFDRAVVEIDRSTVCEVDDTSQTLLNKPLVAAFRVRGPAPEQAFTFTLVNVEVDPTQAELELNLLAEVFRAVRDDRRGEDDVLVLGSFGVNENNLGGLGRVPHMMWSITGVPTTVLGNQTLDNILFDSRATTEFVGRSGTMNLSTELDLSVRQAVQISEHLPVWAEFSVFEGGQVGRIAGARGETPR